ncbi:hypothetical protein RND81_10G210400 [Saponaria officinalis]|uniref:F-box domain-containing protein n=1 Tax=Saponaria officinalis TaxID=3572 RepID=A0AAW1I4D3_SAPOF
MSSKEDDRLSSLPNDIKITILSLLPLKSAISTSILSRSWRYTWTRITAFRFTSPYYVTHKFYLNLYRTLGRMSWQQVYTVELNIVPQTTTLGTVNLNMVKLGHYLLCNAHNIKEFKVKFEVNRYLISVPLCIFEMQSIEVLELGGITVINPNINYKLPKLRELVIDDLCSFDLVFLGYLLKSCPMLEILRVNVDFREKTAYPIEIKSRNLRWVLINMSGACRYSIQGEEEKVVFDAPKLEYLEFNSPIILKFYFLQTPSELLRAKLSLGDGKSNKRRADAECGVGLKKRLLTVLNPICGVKSLSLSGDNIFISLRNRRIDENDVQVFEKLTHVEMKLSSTSNNSLYGVRRFLQRCPNLKSLVMLKKRGTYKWVINVLLTCLLETKLKNTSNWWEYDGSEYDMKLIFNFVNVVKDDTMMIEITIHVYQDDQFIKCINGFVLPNHLWRRPGFHKSKGRLAIIYCKNRHV